MCKEILLIHDPRKNVIGNKKNSDEEQRHVGKDLVMMSGVHDTVHCPEPNTWHSAWHIENDQSTELS